MAIPATAKQAVDIFRQNVLDVMEKQGINVSELARKAKVNRTGLSRFLNGHQDCAMTYAYRLASALGMHITKLLKEE